MPRRRPRLSEQLWDCFVTSHVPRARPLNDLQRERLSAAARLAAWRRWQRDAAIRALEPMVAKIARHEARQFARHIDIRDLIQAGYVGLMDAARRFHPDAGEFERYAYFRVRGAIIDSQKRRVYREEQNPSLQAIAEAHGGWLPPALDTAPGAGPEELAIANERRERLRAAIAALQPADRALALAQMRGESMTETARIAGRSVTWTRARLAEVRAELGRRVRGESEE
jgi:RNA polymerase sigma factor (sigma-70 family)